jgi:hypothetical protein
MYWFVLIYNLLEIEHSPKVRSNNSRDLVPPRIPLPTGLLEVGFFLERAELIKRLWTLAITVLPGMGKE